VIDPLRRDIEAPGDLGVAQSIDEKRADVQPQRTLEFLALIRPPDGRVVVGSEIPDGQPLTGNTLNGVVWRDAAIGRELAPTYRRR